MDFCSNMEESMISFIDIKEENINLSSQQYGDRTDHIEVHVLSGLIL